MQVVRGGNPGVVAREELIDGRVCWYATASQPAARRDGIAAVRAWFAGWHDPISAILAATPALLRHDLYDLALPLVPFAVGPVVLLGTRRTR